MSETKNSWWNSIPLLLLMFGCGLIGGIFSPDCSGASETTVAEQVLGDQFELLAPDAAHPETFFTYNVRHLEDGWTAEDVGFTWCRPDGTLVQDEMPADRVSFVLTDQQETPRVEFVMFDHLERFCDDESKTPQQLTHTCTRFVVIHCTPEQLQRAMPAD